MKYLGKIVDPKDIVNKEYMESEIEKSTTDKLENSDFQEYTEDEVIAMWNSVFGGTAGV